MKFIYPFKAPWTITRGFGFQADIYMDGRHGAIDIIPYPRAALGEPILAIADGQAVASPSMDPTNGWNVYIDHADGWRSCYRHLRDRGLSGVVKQGQEIGKCGNTGLSTGPHLHFDLWHKAKQSPEAYKSQNGWYKHDPAVWLGQEDDMPSEADWNALAAKVAALETKAQGLQNEVNTLAKENQNQSQQAESISKHLTNHENSPHGGGGGGSGAHNH